MTKLQNCSQKFQELLHHIKNEIFYIFVGTTDESGLMSGPNGRSIWIIFFEIFWNPKMYKNGIFRIEIHIFLWFKIADCWKHWLFHGFIPAGIADESESPKTWIIGRCVMMIRTLIIIDRIQDNLMFSGPIIWTNLNKKFCCRSLTLLLVPQTIVDYFQNF